MATVGLLLVSAQCATPATPHQGVQDPAAMAQGQLAQGQGAVAGAAGASSATGAAAQGTPERGAIAKEYRWNTTHLFATDEAWEQERQALAAAVNEIADCKGKLKKGKATVRACLERHFGMRKRIDRAMNYAHRLYDQDTRVAKYQGYKEVIEKVATDYAEASAFLQPELLALSTPALQGMIEDRSFADYNQYLRDLVRQKAHVLSPPEEKLLASAALMRDSGYTTYSAFTGADLTFPEIRDENGKTVRLDQAQFTKYRTSPDRRVRRDTFDAFFSTFRAYGNTVASLLGSQVNANIVYARARHYGSALEAALATNNIPVAVYKNMIAAVNKHLPLLHRYLKLRQARLGLKDLNYYDLYPPIVEKTDMKIPYNEGSALVMRALSPMGKAYVDALAQGLATDSGWVDAYPNKGKHSGAYMDGSAYDVHPFVLHNYLDDFKSVSTLAHEMGHAMHSYFTSKTQPYAKADYAIFVAEVASTLNEALLMHHMMAEVKDPRQRLFLLGEQLEGFRQTIFRQAMFAEFELRVYERAERKEALTADEISKIYLEVARRYYGHDAGVVRVDDLYGIEWAYVPHFYYGFYVFQYVTGMTAAIALEEMITDPKEGATARDRYIDHMLKTGGSDYPIDLLRRAGVDLTTSAPYDVAMRSFERTLVQAEEEFRALAATRQP